jgi:hypothetical protein
VHNLFFHFLLVLTRFLILLNDPENGIKAFPLLPVLWCSASELMIIYYRQLRSISFLAVQCPRPLWIATEVKCKRRAFIDFLLLLIFFSKGTIYWVGVAEWKIGFSQLNFRANDDEDIFCWSGLWGYWDVWQERSNYELKQAKIVCAYVSRCLGQVVKW